VSQIYIFTCRSRNGHGHRWYEPHFGFVLSHELQTLDRLFPQIDTGYAPKDPQQAEGRAALTHVYGWTVLAWWDRSVDMRPNSNTALAIDLNLDFEQMVALLGVHFPEVLKRQQATLVRVAETWISSKREGGMPVIAESTVPPQAEGVIPLRERRSLSDEWAEFFRQCVPKGAPPLQLRETRRAWYAGASSLFALMEGGFDVDHEPTDLDVAYLESINQELAAFARDLEAGTA
jgi:hypothetical protein